MREQEKAGTQKSSASTREAFILVVVNEVGGLEKAASRTIRIESRQRQQNPFGEIMPSRTMGNEIGIENGRDNDLPSWPDPR